VFGGTIECAGSATSVAWSEDEMSFGTIKALYR